MTKFFVTGIGTDVGKTVISAILVEKLKADYWKPVQSGDLDNTDTLKVKSLVSNPVSIFHSEAYRLNSPLSPHHSAKIDGIRIDPSRIVLPETSNEYLIVEGVGGLMAPLNSKYMMIDLAGDLRAGIILVSKIYLGSINHTLLSIEALKQRGLPLLGIIFNGNVNMETENIILEYSGVKCIGRIPETTFLNRNFVADCGKLIHI